MAHTVKGLINTSAEDVQISLQYIYDVALLDEALAAVKGKPGQKTKAQHIARRIKQLGR